MSATVNNYLKIGKGFCTYRGVDIDASDGSLNAVIKAINVGVPDSLITLAVENKRFNLLKYFVKLTQCGLLSSRVLELIYRNINNENLETYLRDSLLVPRKFDELLEILVSLNNPNGIDTFRLAQQGYSMEDIRKVNKEHINI